MGMRDQTGNLVFVFLALFFSKQAHAFVSPNGCNYDHEALHSVNESTGGLIGWRRVAAGADAEECLSACDAMPHCTAAQFVFDTTNMLKPSCRLYNLPDPVAQSTSGILGSHLYVRSDQGCGTPNSDCPLQVLHDTAYTATSLGQQVLGLWDCSAACDYATGCVGFTHLESTDLCLLLADPVKNKMSMPGYKTYFLPSYAGGCLPPVSAAGCEYEKHWHRMNPAGSLQHTTGVEIADNVTACLSACDSMSTCSAVYFATYNSGRICLLSEGPLDYSLAKDSAGGDVYYRGDNTCGNPNEHCPYIKDSMVYSGTLLSSTTLSSTYKLMECYLNCQTTEECMAVEKMGNDCRMLKYPITGKSVNGTRVTYFKPELTGGCYPPVSPAGCAYTRHRFLNLEHPMGYIRLDPAHSLPACLSACDSVPFCTAVLVESYAGTGRRCYLYDHPNPLSGAVEHAHFDVHVRNNGSCGTPNDSCPYLIEEGTQYPTAMTSFASNGWLSGCALHCLNQTHCTGFVLTDPFPVSPEGCSYETLRWTTLTFDGVESIRLGFISLATAWNRGSCLAACDSMPNCNVARFNARADAKKCSLYYVNDMHFDTFSKFSGKYNVYRRLDAVCGTPNAACPYAREQWTRYEGTELQESTLNLVECQETCTNQSSCIGYYYTSTRCRLLSEPLIGRVFDPDEYTELKPSYTGGCDGNSTIVSADGCGYERKKYTRFLADHAIGFLAVPLYDLDRCLAACDSMFACMGAQLNQYNGWECYLFSDANTTADDTVFDAYVRFERICGTQNAACPYLLDQDTTYTATILSNHSLPLDTCQSECEANPDCAAFTSEGALCTLLDGLLTNPVIGSGGGDTYHKAIGGCNDAYENCLSTPSSIAANGTCYSADASLSKPASYAEAAATCYSLGGSVAVLPDPESLALVTAQMTRTYALSLWQIPGSNTPSAGWLWRTNGRLFYANPGWTSNQPNDNGGALGTNQEDGSENWGGIYEGELALHDFKLETPLCQFEQEPLQCVQRVSGGGFCSVKGAPECYEKRVHLESRSLGRNTTFRGLTCQAWSSQSPHTNGYSGDSLWQGLGLSGAAEAGNWCANPAEDEPGPWCYTTDPAVRWDFCFLPCPAHRIDNRPCVQQNSDGSHCAIYNTHSCQDTTSVLEEMKRLNLRTTRGGMECQAWASQTPHIHDRDYLPFWPGVTDSSELENHCGNPDMEAGPWCYTTNSTFRWDYCLPQCPDGLEESLNFVPPPSDNSHFEACMESSNHLLFNGYCYTAELTHSPVGRRKRAASTQFQDFAASDKACEDIGGFLAALYPRSLADVLLPFILTDVLSNGTDGRPNIVLVSLWQAPGATGPEDDWFWTLPDGQVRAFNESDLWAGTEPDDCCVTSGSEDNEEDFGLIRFGGTGFCDGLASDGSPFCQFPGIPTATIDSTEILLAT